MNKKAVELSITQLIGFVIVAVIFLGTIGLVMKIVGIMAEKPDEATLNSFENLMHEINTIEDGQTKIVPYYIGEGLYLKSECEPSLNKDELGDDICICKKDCKKRIVREFQDSKLYVEIKGGSIVYENQVINLAIIRDSNKICLTKDLSETVCEITR